MKQAIEIPNNTTLQYQGNIHCIVFTNYFIYLSH